MSHLKLLKHSFYKRFGGVAACVTGTVPEEKESLLIESLLIEEAPLCQTRADWASFYKRLHKLQMLQTWYCRGTIHSNS